MHTQARQPQARRHALGKQISVFGERLAVSPLDRVDATIVEGLNTIIDLVDADRICWYEVEEESAALLHKYTAGAKHAPLSPKSVPQGKMPFLEERLVRHEIVVLEDLKDLPSQGHADRQFLEGLGVKSLLLIPSSYSQRRKGVLGLASYSVEVTWSEESINRLAIAANIIGAALERKHAHVASQESEKRFRYLFAQASIGIAIETMEGRILEVNPAFCTMVGYSPEELLSSSCSRITHPDDEEIEKVLFEELRQGLRPSYRMEKRFFHKDGSQIWGQVSVSLLNTNQGSAPLVIGMVSDVTAQKTAEANLYQRDRELQHLTGRLIEAQEEERRHIARELHDDVGQQEALLAIRLQRIELELPSDSPAQLRNDVQQSINQISELCRTVLALSHRLHSSKLELRGLVSAMKGFCQEFSEQQAMKIDFTHREVPKDLPQDVSLCLFRILQESLQNAAKHSGCRDFAVHVEGLPDQVQLTVRDSGIGFDVEQAIQQRGLGLLSMRERLGLLKGTLHIVSRPQDGTEVKVQLPVAKNCSAEISKAEDKPITGINSNRQTPEKSPSSTHMISDVILNDKRP
jgi:PAS domain S-box-containing protein